METIQFKALDYTAQDAFEEAEYEFAGDQATGWSIRRNGAPYLSLGPGYRLLKTRLCGVCSTDLDRRFLPFPLPQITGHEVIAEDPDGQSYVVEINDTYAARGDAALDSFCLAGIPTHSPDRMVLGIDRLPGGFGPYILAPRNAAIPFQGIPDRAAVLVEPFAASLQAVVASPPRDGDQVAVLGPGRLGSLVICALHAYRSHSGRRFTITALARRKPPLELARKLGADDAIDLTGPDAAGISFDIVYDTTSTPDGFLAALDLARREVHLKTTNGQTMGGLRHLTELVVDELSILPFSADNLNFRWEGERSENTRIYLAPSLRDGPVERVLRDQGLTVDRSGPEDAARVMENFTGRLPRFDLGLAGSLEEIDRIIRPVPGSEVSLVRPRGAILFVPADGLPADAAAAALVQFFRKGKIIRTSRCGDFHLALRLLQENPEVGAAMATHIVSHEFGSARLPEAFTTARTPDAVKVIIKHETK